MIEGVKVKELRVIPDDRGRLMEILRADDEMFSQFGQVYLTTTLPGVVKAWHCHHKQDDNVCCVSGMIKLAVYDDRRDSPTFGQVNEFYLGEHSPRLVHIPAFLYHGWKCVSPGEALIINTVTRAYDHTDPDEHRLPAHESHIPYDWSLEDR